MGCGPGCGTETCYNCDGTCGDVIPYGPFDGMNQFKKRLMCGDGCGGTYVGEWASTPPDVCDPCCGDQWVGGARKCRPFCWQPGALLKGLYGSRFCSPAESTTPCGCGGCVDEGCCDSCGGEYIGGEIMTGEVAPGGSGGCATCNASHQTGMSRISQQVAPMSYRTGADVRMDARVNRIRR